MKRVLFLAISLSFLVTITAAFAADYNYVKQETFKDWLESGKKMIIVDIQAPADFKKKHFRESVETNAYPVKSDEERQRLDHVLQRIHSSTDDVIIVCPRGGGGAKNTYDYLKSKGADESRIFILEKGMEGWPYPELCVKGERAPTR